MSLQKKKIRENFRTSVFKRDRDKCVMCSIPAKDCAEGLDAHHITDRNELENGGYVKENGISLCPTCHVLAEKHHVSGGKDSHPGFSPDDLYARIGSSKAKAIEADKRNS